MLKQVSFLWDDKHGECEDCGLPAAFLRTDPLYSHKLCAVCAANSAADGENISRIEAL